MNALLDAKKETDKKPKKNKKQNKKKQMQNFLIKKSCKRSSCFFIEEVEKRNHDFLTNLLEEQRKED